MKSDEITFNMTFEFTEDLQENPINLYEMKEGINYLKKQFEIDFSAQNAGLIGVYSRIVRDFDEAVMYLNIAIELHKNLNNLHGIYINKIRLAHTYQWLHDFKKAELLFSELLEGIDQLDNTTRNKIEDFLYQHIGKNKYDQGNYEEALIYFYSACDLRKQKKNKKLIESNQLAINRTIYHINNQ